MRAEDRCGGAEGRREPTYFPSIHLLTWPLKETFHRDLQRSRLCSLNAVNLVVILPRLGFCSFI